MKRLDVVKKIGENYLTENLETGEFSYPKAFKQVGKKFNKIDTFERLDIRFEDKETKISILVETKEKFSKWKEEKIIKQLQAYIDYEKQLTNNKIIAILCETDGDKINVFWGSDLIIDDSHKLDNQSEIKTFEEYADLYIGKKNNKQEVLRNTYKLNELLHKHGVIERLRAQFVGTILLSLKYNLKYEDLSTSQILSGIKEILEKLLTNDINKANKIVILNNKVLEEQVIKELPKEAIQEIIDFIYINMFPYINDKNTMGQDILSLFFTSFNKYVGKSDKNQAFTPDHITHFMSKVVNVNRNSRILDPCCGSGSFLVRAMVEAMDDSSTNEEKLRIKKEQIYGFEIEDIAFGLSTTNMLIHGDGNSNIYQKNCFKVDDGFFEKAKIDIVLMNPPYNAQRRYCEEKYVEDWKSNIKEDPSQGFHFVYYIASKVKKGKMAVLLPMQCAIADSGDILSYKEKMLEEHTLDAVFSLPAEIFYPGASASVCCMVFNLGVRHRNSEHKETFFGYFKDDGFVKKKNLGRVEKLKKDSNESLWRDIESHWLQLYRERKTEAGLSVCKEVTAKDEWLAEAYMETDYSKLTEKDFEKTIRDYLSYLVKFGDSDYE